MGVELQAIAPLPIPLKHLATVQMAKKTCDLRQLRPTPSPWERECICEYSAATIMWSILTDASRSPTELSVVLSGSAAGTATLKIFRRGRLKTFRTIDNYLHCRQGRGKHILLNAEEKLTSWHMQSNDSRYHVFVVQQPRLLDLDHLLFVSFPSNFSIETSVDALFQLKG